MYTKLYSFSKLIGLISKALITIMANAYLEELLEQNNNNKTASCFPYRVDNVSFVESLYFDTWWDIYTGDRHLRLDNSLDEDVELVPHRKSTKPEAEYSVYYEVVGISNELGFTCVKDKTTFRTVTIILSNHVLSRVLLISRSAKPQ